MASASILVVDDETAIADLVEVYLSNEGFTVHKFHNAADALACVEREDLDLAILDVMLPDICLLYTSISPRGYYSKFSCPAQPPEQKFRKKAPSRLFPDRRRGMGRCGPGGGYDEAEAVSSRVGGDRSDGAAAGPHGRLAAGRGQRAPAHRPGRRPAARRVGGAFPFRSGGRESFSGPLRRACLLYTSRCV